MSGRRSPIRAFAALFERAGRRPEELLFVDDQLGNVEAARALGMSSIHFGPGVDLERELIERARPKPARRRPLTQKSKPDLLLSRLKMRVD